MMPAIRAEKKGLACKMAYVQAQPGVDGLRGREERTLVKVLTVAVGLASGLQNLT